MPPSVEYYFTKIRNLEYDNKKLTELNQTQQQRITDLEQAYQEAQQEINTTIAHIQNLIGTPEETNLTELLQELTNEYNNLRQQLKIANITNSLLYKYP